jgi:hypothetical protein
MTPQQKEKIQKEFDKKFGEVFTGFLASGSSIESTVNLEKIKKFIFSKLDQAVKEREEEIVEKIENVGDPLFISQETRQRVINLIKEK